MILLHCGVVVIITAQLDSIKHEFRFCTGSNPNHGSEICNGKNHWQWYWLELRHKCLLLVNHSAKRIYHHHHHYHHLKKLSDVVDKDVVKISKYSKLKSKVGKLELKILSTSNIQRPI